MRIERAIVSAARIVTTAFSSDTGRPETRAASSSSETANRPRSSTAIVASAASPRVAITTRSPRVTVRIEPKRYWKRFTFSAPADETITTPAAMPV